MNKSDDQVIESSSSVIIDSDELFIQCLFENWISSRAALLESAFVKQDSPTEL